MWMLHVPFTALEIDPNHLDFVRSFGNDVRYGDASRLELLHAAKADAAKVLVIAIDDVEASVAIARLAREHFPHLTVLARARNRTHALALMDAGVADVRRETLASALETTTATLRALGVDAAEAQRIVDRFRDHDEETLRRQATVWTDDAKVIETARESAARLRQLFERDEVA
jgi:voltage-gated potassium channel Kch